MAYDTVACTTTATHTKKGPYLLQQCSEKKKEKKLAFFFLSDT